MRQALVDLWVWFADTECRAYSPLYDAACRAVARDAAALELVDAAPPAAHLPTVLLAAVHDLVLRGVDHPLVDVYAGRSDADPGATFVDLCHDYADELATLLATRHTNTNEVGRSALIGPALTRVAERLGGPLALVDVGCSAGLNLRCDRYRLDYGTFGATGPEGAAVAVPCEVTGGRPPIADRLPTIAHRVGIDRDPVDLRDGDARRWLLACTWPDTGRLERTRVALEEASAEPPLVVTGDAVALLSEVIDAVPAECTPVVVTTAAHAYLSLSARAEFDAALAAIGKRRPVAWFSMEQAGVVAALGDVIAPRDAKGSPANVLGLVIDTPDGRETRLLGFGHSHGHWIDWRDVEVARVGAPDS